MLRNVQQAVEEYDTAVEKKRRSKRASWRDAGILSFAGTLGISAVATGSPALTMIATIMGFLLGTPAANDVWKSFRESKASGLAATRNPVALMLRKKPTDR